MRESAMSLLHYPGVETCFAVTISGNSILAGLHIIVKTFYSDFIAL